MEAREEEGSVTDESLRDPPAGTGEGVGSGEERHRHIAEMRRHGRLTDEEAHRAHRLVDAGRYDELGTFLQVKAAADARSDGLGLPLVLRTLVALTAGIVLLDFVLGLL